MVTSQQLNINLTDKVFWRVRRFWEEPRAHRIWGQLQLLLNPCLTPYRDPEGLTGKDWGLRRSFRQMKMIHGFLLSVSAFCLPFSLRRTHTYSNTSLSFPLYFIYSMQPCTLISLFLSGCCPTSMSSPFISLAKTGRSRLRKGRVLGEPFFLSLCDGRVTVSTAEPSLCWVWSLERLQSGGGEEELPVGVFTWQEYWYCKTLLYKCICWILCLKIS